MHIFGLAGWSGSGKTTLMIKLIPALARRGITVSTVKHAHHDFDIDKPGKDSYEHRAAGAKEVLVSSGKRWALMHELREEPEATLEDITRQMSPVDLLLVEGFKREDHAKLEVHRSATGKPLLQPDDDKIVGVISDEPLPGSAVPVIDIDDVEGVAAFIIEYCGLTAD